MKPITKYGLLYKGKLLEFVIEVCMSWDKGTADFSIHLASTGMGIWLTDNLSVAEKTKNRRRAGSYYNSDFSFPRHNYKCKDLTVHKVTLVDGKIVEAEAILKQIELLTESMDESSKDDVVPSFGLWKQN